MAEELFVLAATWVAGKVGAEIVKVGGSLLTKVAGPSADELGAHYGERVKAWRATNLFQGAARAQGLLTERGVEAREIPLPVLWPLLERMSLCDDEMLSEQWAELLANAADPTFPGMIHPTYSAILAELTPTDAKLLKWAYEHHDPFEYGDFHSYAIEFDTLIYRDKTWTDKEISHSVGVLEKQGILRRVAPDINVRQLKEAVLRWTSPSQRHVPDFSPQHKFKDRRGGVAFTRMGAEFVRACSRRTVSSATENNPDEDAGVDEDDLDV